MTDHPERRQISARIFPHVYEAIEKAAKANHRSLGAEIAFRLERSVMTDRANFVVAGGNVTVTPQTTA